MKKKLGTLIFSVLFSAVSWAQQSHTRISQQVDSLLNDAYTQGIFSGQVAIAHNGEQLYCKPYGFADWKTKRAIDQNTLFNIGSLNKQFTEEMIHQLVAEKKLAYTDKLNQYLDLYPDEIGSKITIQQLLDMKAGLGDYLQNPKFEELQFKDFSLTDLLALIKTEPLLFEPGTNQMYSNSGYVVLGAIIEKITNETFQVNLSKRILKPLGLEHMYYTKAEKGQQPNRAWGTDILFDGTKICFDDISNSTPAGGLYTTINDLLKFAEAKRKSALPSGRKYGSGQFAGGTPFWNSVISCNENTGFTFVIMANTGGIADELAFRINAILKNEAYPPLALPFNRVLYKTINEKGIEYVKTHVNELAEQARVPYDDRFLNFYGYQFLHGNRADIAIALFKMNTELFPQVANTFDSLAEAYLQTGDKTNALLNYKMELELTPNNQRVKDTIANLEKGK